MTPSNLCVRFMVKMPWVLIILTIAFSALESARAAAPWAYNPRFCERVLKKGIAARTIALGEISQLLHAPDPGAPGQRKDFLMFLEELGRVQWSRGPRNLLVYREYDNNGHKIGPERHEVLTAEAYANWIQADGESLLLIPAVNRMSLPAIDGIVFGPNGQLRRFVSLKTLSTEIRDRALEAVRLARTMARRFLITRSFWAGAMMRQIYPAPYVRHVYPLDTDVLSRVNHLKTLLDLIYIPNLESPWIKVTPVDIFVEIKSSSLFGRIQGRSKKNLRTIFYHQGEYRVGPIEKDGNDD